MTAAGDGRSVLPSADIFTRSVLEQFPGITYVAEPGDTGKWLFISPQVEQLVGCTPEEWLSSTRPFIELVHPDDLERLRAGERDLLARRALYEMVSTEFRIFTRAGELRWVRCWEQLIEGEDGRDLLQGLMLDVTARRLAEEAERDANRVLKTLFDSAPLAIMSWDRAGRILSWNPAAERIFGWSEEEVRGRFLPQVPESEVPEMLNYIERGFRGDVWRDVELPRQRKDGSLVQVSISSGSIRDDTGKIVAVMSIMTDITERKQAEEQLRLQEEQLRQAQKLDAVGKLAGGVAHDFNNLLTAILGEAELILDDLPGDDPVRPRIETVAGAAEHAAALTRQLLAFGRRQHREPRLLRLEEVIGRLERLLRRVVGEDISVETSFAAGVPAIEGDPSQIEQVVLNLVLNARDAMPRGGRLLIGTCAAETVSGPAAMLFVRDSGIGMDEDVRERAFEPFFTTKPVGEGTGLGLSTVYGIVMQGGGSISIDSAPGAGTTFEIAFPAAPGTPPAESPATERPAAPARPGRGVVLLVEDEDLVRALARRLLVRDGYVVIEAASGEEALTLAEGHAAAIDLLVCDVVMPGMGGPDLAERLLAERPGLPVLFMSGYNDSAVAGYTRNGVDVDLLPKPFTPATFSERVAAAIAPRAAGPDGPAS